MVHASREALASVSAHVSACEAAGCDVSVLPLPVGLQVIATDPDTGRQLGLKRRLTGQDRLVPVAPELVEAWLSTLPMRRQ